MGGTGVIDQFLEVFTRYIDGGFGLLGGEVAFIAAWAEGNAMPLAEAVAAAQDVLVLQEAETAQPDVAPPAPPTSTVTGFRLTMREREVLQLLVVGQSDKEIAAALGISAGTVRSRLYRARAHVAERLARTGNKAGDESMVTTP